MTQDAINWIQTISHMREYWPGIDQGLTDAQRDAWEKNLGPHDPAFMRRVCERVYSTHPHKPNLTVILGMVEVVKADDRKRRGGGDSGQWCSHEDQCRREQEETEHLLNDVSEAELVVWYSQWIEWLASSCEQHDRAYATRLRDEQEKGRGTEPGRNRLFRFWLADRIKHNGATRAAQTQLAVADAGTDEMIWGLE